MWTWGVSAAAILFLAVTGFAIYQLYLKPANKYIAEKPEVNQKPTSKIVKPVKPVTEAPKPITTNTPQPKIEANNNIAVTKEIEKPVIKIEKKIIKPKPIHAFEKSLTAKKPKQQYTMATKPESYRKPYDFHTKQGLGTSCNQNRLSLPFKFIHLYLKMMPRNG